MGIGALIASTILKKTIISEELYDKNFRVDWFLDAQEMLEHGIIDEILTEII
jgi:ATP-dependent protease ClpP protease subunit